MNDFVYYSPTRIYFGRGKVEKIGKEIGRYGKNVLLTYGGGSIMKNGIYDDVIRVLKQYGLKVTELGGIRPNPSVESVREGIQLCREHSVDFILAVGGGSIIDCSKAIAAGVFYEGDPWDFFIDKAKSSRALPLGSVLTLSATGSEMNGGTVISNDETEEKFPYTHEMLRPKFSVLDPAYTFSVDAYQTAAGVADIMSHCLEQYFSPTPDTFLQDRLTEAILKVCVHYGPVAINEPKNYDARANLMWASSLALTGMLASGKEGDWATHYIEHKISAVSGLTHGIGLAILTPAWMEEVLDEQRIPKFISLAENLWQIEGALSPGEKAHACISRFREFFKELDIPSSLKELNIRIDDEKLKLMAEDIVKKENIGKYKSLGKEEVYRILKAVQ